jgi:hypothetical protein
VPQGRVTLQCSSSEPAHSWVEEGERHRRFGRTIEAGPFTRPAETASTDGSFDPRVELLFGGAEPAGRLDGHRVLSGARQLHRDGGFTSVKASGEESSVTKRQRDARAPEGELREETLSRQRQGPGTPKRVHRREPDGSRPRGNAARSAPRRRGTRSLQIESWEADIGREDRGRRPIAYPRGSGSPSLEGGTASRSGG